MSRTAGDLGGYDGDFDDVLVAYSPADLTSDRVESWSGTTRQRA